MSEHDRSLPPWVMVEVAALVVREANSLDGIHISAAAEAQWTDVLRSFAASSVRALSACPNGAIGPWTVVTATGATRWPLDS